MFSDLEYQFINLLIAIVLIPIHFVGQYYLGLLILKITKSSINDEDLVGIISTWLLGLLFYLLMVLLICCLGIELKTSVILPYLFCFIFFFKYNDHRILIPNYSAIFNWNRVIFFFVTLAIGLTVVSYRNGAIFTAWKNNYGDIAFHLGLISSFISDHNFPPTYNIYSGEILSYPFLMNLWSATLFVYYPKWSILPLIFLLQWVVLWQVIFTALKGDKVIIFPWLIFLAGGTYFSLLSNSGEHIQSGHVWTTLLGTIWIPQRASIFGVTVAVVILTLFSNWRETKDRSYLKQCGLLVGLAPLAHVHLALVPAAFISVYLLSDIIMLKKDSILNLLSFLIPSSLSLHAIYFISSKSSLVQFVPKGIFADLKITNYDFIVLTFENFWPLILFFVLFSFALKFKKECFIFVLLTLNFWCIKSSVWTWDQSKVLVGLYIVMIWLWYDYRNQVTQKFIIFFPILIFPAVMEIYSVIKSTHWMEVFSKEKVGVAVVIQKKIPIGKVILTAQDHNSAAQLSGKSLYLGYGGWLWSHGINYDQRESKIKDLDGLIDSCQDKNCPDYLIWTEDERRLWKSLPKNSTNLEQISPEVYKINR